MPQKKNPDALELLRGKSGRVFGSFSSLFITMKGLPMTYNRDMQEDKEPIFEAADQLAGSLEMMRVVVESATLRPEIPAAAAEDSWVVATDLAEALARNGTPFHQAHQIPPHDSQTPAHLIDLTDYYIAGLTAPRPQSSRDRCR